MTPALSPASSSSSISSPGGSRERSMSGLVELTAGDPVDSSKLREASVRSTDARRILTNQEEMLCIRRNWNATTSLTRPTEEWKTKKSCYMRRGTMRVMEQVRVVVRDKVCVAGSRDVVPRRQMSNEWRSEIGGNGRSGIGATGRVKDI